VNPGDIVPAPFYKERRADGAPARFFATVD
jgi:hypothetical protein